MATTTSEPNNDPEFTYTPPPTTAPSPPLTGSANISIREYIYFLPHPLPAGTPIPYTPGLPSSNPLNLAPHPFEPTSTLVLTTPGRTFVDLRYLKPLSPSASALPNHGDPSRLDWGFAGTSSSAPAPSPPHPQYGAFAHATWTHWLDSRFSVGEQVPVDEGDMYELGEGMFLEHGVAFHPHLGRVAGHEEAWRDVDVCSTSGSGGKICVALRCVDEQRGVRGVVVRVGRFCQAVVMVGGQVATERWEFQTDEERDLEEGKWTRTARTGDLFLPCAVTFRPEVLGLGGRVRGGGLEWVVEEVWEWK